MKNIELIKSIKPKDGMNNVIAQRKTNEFCESREVFARP
jgi:hypothetical protein